MKLSTKIARRIAERYSAHAVSTALDAVIARGDLDALTPAALVEFVRTLGFNHRIDNRDAARNADVRARAGDTA